MDTLDIFFLLLASTFVIFWLRHWSLTGGGPRNLPPGPPGWPILGNLPQVLFRRDPFIFAIRHLRRRYGPIFTMQMGQRTLVIVTSSDLIHEALIQKGSRFASRPGESPTRLLFSVGKCSINSAEYGPLLRALRRNFAEEVTSPARVKQCGWARDWALKAHEERLIADMNRTGYVEVRDHCRLSTCSILLCICFGFKIPDRAVRNVESILKEVMLITSPKLPDFLPALMPLFRWHYKSAKELRIRQLECLVPLIRKRRTFVESGGGHDDKMMSPIGAAYVDSLFKLEPPGRGRLGEEELVTLVSEVINAGTDTTATTVEWSLLEIMLNQEIQEKLYSEIAGRVGKTGTMINDSDVEKMPFLNAVVKETLRRHPPSHFLLPYAVTMEGTIGGYNIPAGVIVEFYTAWMTEDPEKWSDPDVFRPARFLEGGEGVDVDVTGTKGVRMVPFGAGRRICPAINLGTMHVNLMLARMVQAFKWDVLPGGTPDQTETYAFTVVMKKPLRAMISRRPK